MPSITNFNHQPLSLRWNRDMFHGGVTADSGESTNSSTPTHSEAVTHATDSFPHSQSEEGNTTQPSIIYIRPKANSRPWYLIGFKSELRDTFSHPGTSENADIHISSFNQFLREALTGHVKQSRARSRSEDGSINESQEDLERYSKDACQKLAGLSNGTCTGTLVSEETIKTLKKIEQKMEKEGTVGCLVYPTASTSTSSTGLSGTAKLYVDYGSCINNPELLENLRSSGKAAHIIRVNNPGQSRREYVAGQLRQQFMSSIDCSQNVFEQLVSCEDI
ncbi:uncharacterized protein IL334_002151 [Kwoniella shivajii]|uniref:Uncharacterized protein n=1 Tax=Kwoniella shivajii TaxID=564305 RepID=A0ABZ1CU28_9TREE|nr:hypothetical protein IL334_002151 [Kwoniella shivajii]